jgi:hypothetical protein
MTGEGMDPKGNIYADSPATPVTEADEQRLHDFLSGEAKNARQEGLQERLKVVEEEREARRPDVVEAIAARLRHSYFVELDPRRSTEIAEDLLETVGAMLIGDSALEHAEPVVEHAVETAMHPQHPEAALAPPKTIARSTIASAMKAIRMPIPQPYPAADPIFDAFATSAERCEWEDDEFTVCATRRTPSISTDGGWAYHLVIERGPGRIDGGPLGSRPHHVPDLAVATVSDLEFEKSPEFVEHSVRQLCEEIGWTFVLP